MLDHFHISFVATASSASKWPEAYAIPVHEAETVAAVLVDEFFIRFWVPGELYCKGASSSAEDTDDAASPPGDGMVDRFNRTLAGELAKYCREDQQD